MTHPSTTTVSAQRLMVDVEHLLPCPSLDQPSTRTQPQPVDTATLSSLLSQLAQAVAASPTQHTASALSIFLSTLRHRLPLIKPTPNCDDTAAILFQHLAHLFRTLSTASPAWSQTYAHLFATLGDILSLTPATQPTLTALSRDLIPLLDLTKTHQHVSDTSRASIGLLLIQLSSSDACKRALCSCRATLMRAIEHATDALVQEILLEALWRVLPRDVKSKRAILKDVSVGDPGWIQWLVDTKSKDLYPRMRARIVEVNKDKSATREGEYPMTVGVRSARVSLDGAEYVIRQQLVYVDCGRERITCTGAWVGDGLGEGGEDEDEDEADRVLSVPYATMVSVDEDGLDLHIRASYAPSLTDPTRLATAHLVHIQFVSTRDRQRVLAAIRAHAPVSTAYSTSGTLPRQSSALVPLTVTPARGVKTPEIRARAERFVQLADTAKAAATGTATATGQDESQPMDVDMDDGMDASFNEGGTYQEQEHEITRTVNLEYVPPTTQARGHIHLRVHQESTTTTRRPAAAAAAVDRVHIQELLNPSSAGTSSPARPALVTEPTAAEGDAAADDDMVGVTRRGRSARARQIVVSQPDADENQTPPPVSKKRGSSPSLSPTSAAGAAGAGESNKRQRTSKDTPASAARTTKRTTRASAKPPTTAPGGIVEFAAPAPQAPSAAARVLTSDTIGDEESSVTPFEEDLGDGMAGFVPPVIPSGSEYIPTQLEADVGKGARPATRGTTVSESMYLSSSSRPATPPPGAVVTRGTAKRNPQTQVQTQAVAEGRPSRKAAAAGAGGSSAKDSSPKVTPAQGSQGSQGPGKRTTRNSTDSAAALDALATASIASAVPPVATRTQTKKRPAAMPAAQQDIEEEEQGQAKSSSPASGRRVTRSAAPTKRARHSSSSSAPPPVITQPPSRTRTRPPTPPPLDIADMDDEREAFETTTPAGAKRRSPITGRRTPSSPAIPAPAASRTSSAGLPAVVEDVDEDARNTSDTMSAFQLPSPVTRPVTPGAASHVLSTTSVRPRAPAAPVPADDEFKGLMMQLMRSMNEHTMQMRAMAATAAGSDPEQRASSVMAAAGGGGGRRSSSRNGGGIVPGSDEEQARPVTPAPAPAPEVTRMQPPPLPPVQMPAPMMFRTPGPVAKPGVQQQPQRSPVPPSTPWPKFGSTDAPTGTTKYATGLYTPAPLTATMARTSLGAAGLRTPRSMLDTPRHGLYTPQRPSMFATPSSTDRGYTRHAPAASPAAAASMAAPDLPPAVADAILAAYHAMAQAIIAHLSTVCAGNWTRVEEVMRELEAEVMGGVQAWVKKVRGGVEEGVQGLKEGEAARVERERKGVEKVRGVLRGRR